MNESKKFLIIGVLFVLIIFAGASYYFFKVKRIDIFGFLKKEPERNTTDIYIKAYDVETDTQLGLNYILRNDTDVLSKGRLDAFSAKKIKDIEIGMNITLFTYGENGMYSYYQEEKKVTVENNTHIETKNRREGSLSVVEDRSEETDDYTLLVLESMEMTPYGYVNYPMYCVGWEEPIIEINVKDFIRVTKPQRISSKVDRCFVRKKPYWMKPYATEKLYLEVRKESDDIGEFTLYAIDRASFSDGFSCNYGYEYNNQDIGAKDFKQIFKL